jgi:hypothetical protein
LAILASSVTGRLKEFIKPCRQTELLYQRAAQGSCSEESKVAGLPSRLKQINDLCCEQDGHNACASGGPDACKTVAYISHLNTSLVGISFFLVVDQ